MTLSKATALLASRSESTELAMLHGGLADPVHARIASDSLVVWVHEDDLEELVGGILVDPVRVQDAQVRATAPNALLGNALQVTSRLELVHTMAGRLSTDLALGDLALAATTADTDAVDDEALLGLVAEAAGLVGAGGAAGAVDNVQLAELPAADAEDETKDVRLLLLVELFNVLIGTHTRRIRGGWMKQGRVPW